MYKDKQFKRYRKNNCVHKKYSKKAFGDAVSTLIMFIAVISVTTGVVIVFKNYVVDTQDSFSTQSELTSNKLRTAISINNIYYNSSDNKTFIYVKNIGETKLATKLFDIFINDRYEEDYNITYANNFTRLLDISEPGDTFVVINSGYLTSGSHEVKVVTEYGVGDTDSFNN